MEDQRRVFDKMQKDLELILDKSKLSADEKSKLRTAMLFGYSAGFCQGRYDINAMPWQAQGYQDKYQDLLKRLD